MLCRVIDQVPSLRVAGYDCWTARRCLLRVFVFCGQACPEGSWSKRETLYINGAVTENFITNTTTPHTLALPLVDCKSNILPDEFPGMNVVLLTLILTRMVRLVSPRIAIHLFILFYSTYGFILQANRPA